MPIALAKPRHPSELVPSQAAINLIKAFEGLRLDAYQCSADRWTIGWGHASGVQPGDRITLAQAEAFLREDVRNHANIVRRQITEDLTQEQFDSLTALTFNLGRIPPTMRAYINGGHTDRGVAVGPRDYAGALYQFPRNCRSAGRVLRGLYRRRLAEACMFAGLPWESACSENVVHLKLDAAGNIDTNDTTSLEDTLMRARMDIPQPSPEQAIPSEGKREAAPPNPLPPRTPAIETAQRPFVKAVTDPSAEPEGARKAPESSPPPRTTTTVIIDQPTRAPEPAPSKAEGGAGAVGPPVAPAPSVAKPVVIAPKTVDINAIPYGAVDPANGVKNMTDSKRFAGMLIVAGGSVVQVLAAREVITSTAGAIFFDMSRDPVLVALAVGGIFWAIGHLTRKRGQKVITTGMVSATTVLK